MSARGTTEMLSGVATAATSAFADLCVVDIADSRGGAKRVTVTCRDPTRAWVCEALKQTPLDRDQPLITWSVMQSSEPVLAQAPSPEAIAGLPREGGDAKLREALDLASVIAAPLRAGDQTLGVLSLAVFNAHAPYAAGDLQLAAELAWMTALSLENARLARTCRDAAEARVALVRTVSHDLRAPLNAIVLQTQLLHRAVGGDGGRAQRTIEAIHEATDGMNRMLQDVVDLARAEAGLMAMHCDRVPAVRLVRDYAEARTTFVDSSPVEVDAPQTDVEIWADPDRVWQLLDILVAGSSATAQPHRPVRIRVTEREANVELSVANTGFELTCDELAGLFDDLWQAKKSADKAARRQLAIAQGIVEAHDGRMWTTGEPGSGTTVHFTLPVAAQQPASTE